MRAVLCGQRAFGAAAFDLLADRGWEVVLAVSPPSASGGSRRDRLRVKAESAGIPWLSADEFKAESVPERTDLIVAAHAHNFVSRRARDRTTLGAIGYHPSLLPRHRGRDAVRWTLKMGDPIAGGSIYWLSENVDAGDLAAQGWCHVHPGDDAETLWRRDLFPMGLRLLDQTLADLEQGTIVAVPQDPAVATWEPSWDRPPVHRPDLLEIGRAPGGYTVVRERRAFATAASAERGAQADVEPSRG